MWKSQDWKNGRSIRITKDRRESGVCYAVLGARDGRMSSEHDGQVELQRMEMTPRWTWQTFDPCKDHGSDFYLGVTLRNRDWKPLSRAGLHDSVYAAGIMVQLSWNHVFPFRTNRRNRCLPRPVLGAPEWGLRVQPASRGQADHVHGVLLSVWRGLGHAVCPLPHERFRWAVSCCRSPLGTGCSHPLWSLTTPLLAADALLAPDVSVYKEGTSCTALPSGSWLASTTSPGQTPSLPVPRERCSTWRSTGQCSSWWLRSFDSTFPDTCFFLTILLISNSFHL